MSASAVTFGPDFHDLHTARLVRQLAERLNKIAVAQTPTAVNTRRTRSVLALMTVTHFFEELENLSAADKGKDTGIIGAGANCFAELATALTQLDQGITDPILVCHKPDGVTHTTDPLITWRARAVFVTAVEILAKAGYGPGPACRTVADMALKKLGYDLKQLRTGRGGGANEALLRSWVKTFRQGNAPREVQSSVYDLDAIPKLPTKDAADVAALKYLRAARANGFLVLE